MVVLRSFLLVCVSFSASCVCVERSGGAAERLLSSLFSLSVLLVLF